MKRMMALLLALLMMFTLAAADPVETVPSDTENYMIPRQFMSMFDAVFQIYAEQYFDSEEAARLVETYSLTQYDFEGVYMYYGSSDWRVETGFEFESEDAVSPDAPCISWYLFLSDDAEENVWYLAMYSLNQMITYRYQDKADDILHYFQTVAPGDILELPDGYSLITYRTEENDGVMFDLYPSAGSVPAAEEE